MKYYSYYPGCSTEGTGLGLGLSTYSIAEPLDIKFIELDDWNCCGSTPYSSLDELESIVVASRNLALAEKAGFDLVTPCSSCYVTLSNASTHLKENPRLLSQVNQALSVVNLAFSGNLRVRHLVDVLANDITPDFIASRIKKKFNGLKVASYYGCQLVRPAYADDDTESPHSLDRLVEALGAEAVSFPLKARCCGGSLIISEEDAALDLIRKLLDNASANGAECIATACPLCQTNLDAYQSRVNRKFGTNYKLPIMFITQLIGLALDLAPKSLGLDTNIVSPETVLASLTGLSQEVASGA